ICRPPAARSCWRRRPQSRRRGSSPIPRGHVEVAVFIVNNNPTTMGSSRQRFPAAIGCTECAPGAAALTHLFVSSGEGTRRSRNKNPERRAARAGWRNFGEYIFLEDSRYASQRKNTAHKRIYPPCALRCRSG